MAVIPLHRHFSRGDGAGSGRPVCLHPTPQLGEGDGVGGQGWGAWGPGAPLPTCGEQLVGAHTPQLCAQLAPRSLGAGTVHGPGRMGGRNGYWSMAQGSLCWN